MNTTSHKPIHLNSGVTLSKQSGEAVARLAMVKGALAAHGVLDDYLERINSEWEDLTIDELIMILRRASRDDALHCCNPHMEDLQVAGNDLGAAKIFLNSVRLSAKF